MKKFRKVIGLGIVFFLVGNNDSLPVTGAGNIADRTRRNAAGARTIPRK